MRLFGISLCICLTLGCALQADDQREACDSSKCDDVGDGSDAEPGSDSEVETIHCASANVVLPTPDAAIYYNGTFVGATTPARGLLPPGDARLGFAVSGGGYFSRHVVVGEGDPEANEACEIPFDDQHRVAARVWRALWVGVGEVEAVVDGAPCRVTSTREERDVAFEFFEDSLDVISDNAFGVLEWDVERVETTDVVRPQIENDFFHLAPQRLGRLWSELDQRQYDAVFVFWKSVAPSCEIPATYFGLGASPSESTKGMGFVEVKFHVEDVIPFIAFLRANDPGVWIHEWLHTVTEDFFPRLGAVMPTAGTDGSTVHSAELHGYQAPWMDWYADLISGRVSEDGSARGLSPDWLARCTVSAGGCAAGLRFR